MQPATVSLPEALSEWNTPAFAETLMREIQCLAPGTLPLMQGLSRGGVADDSDLSLTLLKLSDDAHNVCARLGVFFSEIIAGCSCGEEPLAMHAYCELQVCIDRDSAEAQIRVVS